LRGRFTEHHRSNLVKALTPILAEIEQDKSREDRGRIGSQLSQTARMLSFCITRFEQTAEELSVEYYNTLINTLCNQVK